MKRMFVVLIAVLFVVGAYGIGEAAISGSAHDFSSGGSGAGVGLNTTGEVCNTCHTPHNASAPGSGPLWDHDLTSATFVPYGDPNGTMEGGAPGQPGPVSQLCLSCHDGTVALDAFGSTTPTTSLSSGNGFLSTDLSNDHPIGFTYDSTMAGTDGELLSPTSLNEVNTDLPLFENSGQMECATCHNAHDQTNSYFLRLDNTGSNLCTTCHNAK
jgi:predicted CXXCH cytochrome family protein